MQVTDGTNTTTHSYDGLGNRISQDVNGLLTRYLLDIQPGLTQVIAATTGASTDRYLHALRSIHAMKNNAGQWIWPTQDGLGSVRQELSDGLAVNGVRSYEPYLTPFNEQGNFGMPFAATGEMVDVSGLMYLRNRYMRPALGQFVSLDPLETPNRYAYVSGNPVNKTDPSGLQDGCTTVFNAFTNQFECVNLSDGQIIAPPIGVTQIYVPPTIPWWVPTVGVPVTIVYPPTGTSVPPQQPPQPEPPPAPPQPQPTVGPTPGPQPTVTATAVPTAPTEITATVSASPLATATAINSGFCPVPTPTATSSATRTAGNCHSNGSVSNFTIGDIAHLQVQAYFLARFLGSSNIEVPIPGSGPNGGGGEADAVLLDEGIRRGASANYAGIYEIKSIAVANSPPDLINAIYQLERYVQNFPNSFYRTSAVAGTWWAPQHEFVGVWTLDPSQSLYATSYYNELWPDGDGMIFYYCENN